MRVCTNVLVCICTWLCSQLCITSLIRDNYIKPRPKRVSVCRFPLSEINLPPAPFTEFSRLIFQLSRCQELTAETTQCKMSRLDYSKWDHIEVSLIRILSFFLYACDHKMFRRVYFVKQLHKEFLF